MDVLIKQFVKATDVILAKAEKINEEFIFILGNTRGDILKDFQEAIARVKKSASSIKPKDSWTAAGHIGTIDAAMREINSLTQSFDPAEIKTAASHTYVLTTKSDIDSYAHEYALFMAEQSRDDLYAGLLAEIRSVKLAAAEAEYKKHPGVAVLYSMYLSDLLRNAPGSDKPAVHLAIERAKDNAFAGDQEKTRSWPLQRFGLVPIKQNIPLEEIFNIATTSGGARAKVSELSGIDSVKKLADGLSILKIGTLLISAITSSVVAYDVTPLVTPGGVDASAGVSAAILKRFNTVKKYGSAPAGKYETTFYDVGSLSRGVIILRTIDGKSYDILGAGGKILSDISVANKILRGPSSRIDAYQKIQAADFEKFIMAMPPESEEVKKSNKLLIQDLVNRITGRIIRYVDTSLMPLPENPRDLEVAISDPKFVEIMSEEFLKSYRECGISADMPADEAIGTFISDLESSIIIQFARSIKLNMIELGPGREIFRTYSGEALKIRLYNIFVDVIKRSVSNSILTKENVYEKILIKDHYLAILKKQLSKANDK